MGNIVYNALRTPDGTVLESKYKWDCKMHTDKNGKVYMLDGGLDYVRCHMIEDQELLTVTLDDPHSQVREVVKWRAGTKVVKLKDMSTKHVQYMLDNGNNDYPQIRKAYKNELKFRKQFHSSD
jgi:hypothetical protein